MGCIYKINIPDIIRLIPLDGVTYMGEWISTEIAQHWRDLRGSFIIVNILDIRAKHTDEGLYSAYR